MVLNTVYYLTNQTIYPKGQICQVGEYRISYLPLIITKDWERRLRSGNRWMKKLFRFFYVRRLVKGKELVVLSRAIADQLPSDMYYSNMTEEFPKTVLKAYAMQSLKEITRPLKESEQHMNLLAILPEEGASVELMDDMLSVAQDMESVHFWTYDMGEKYWVEDKFDTLLLESGIAGMCYYLGEENYENPFRVAGKRLKANEYVILVDFSDRPLCQLWGMDYYIDGCGTKTAKEIKMLTGRRIRVKELRNYLDRGFYARIY